MMGRGRLDEIAGLTAGLIGLLLPLLWIIYNQRGVSTLEMLSLAAGTSGGIVSYCLLQVHRRRVDRAGELGSGYPCHALYHLAALIGPLGGLPLLLAQRMVLGFTADAATASSACYFLSAGSIMLALALLKTLQGESVH